MLFSDISSGLVIGLPVMLTLGPVSLLLLNQGMERGAGEAFPAAVGVATADMTYSSLAAVAGTALVAALNPVAPLLRVGGVLVLCWMAFVMARDSRREVAAIRSRHQLVDPGGTDRPRGVVPQPDELAESFGDSGVAFPVDSPQMIDGVETATLVNVEPATRQVVQGPFAHLRGLRLSAAFYGVTLMNPMTIVLMSAIVIAGGPGIGTAGWAAGMTLASLTAHGGYVLFGALLRRTCSELTLARMGTVSAVVLVALSVHLIFT